MITCQAPLPYSCRALPPRRKNIFISSFFLLLSPAVILVLLLLFPLFLATSHCPSSASSSALGSHSLKMRLSLLAGAFVGAVAVTASPVLEQRQERSAQGDVVVARDIDVRSKECKVVTPKVFIISMVCFPRLDF